MEYGLSKSRQIPFFVFCIKFSLFSMLNSAEGGEKI